MRQISLAVTVVLGCSVGVPAFSSGQDALERLEERLRADQAPQGQAPQNPPAGRKAAPPGYLGVVADDQFERGLGIRILEVVAGGPAQKAGLRPRDVINHINDKPARSMSDLVEQLGPFPAGSKVRIGVERAAVQIELEVTLGQRPPPEQRRFGHFGPIDNGLVLPAPIEEPRRRHLLGVRCTVLTDQTRRVLGTPALQGAMVVEIAPGSPADLAGIPAEAVIVGVDETPVTRPSDLSRLVLEAGAGKEIELEYYSRRTLFKRKIVLAAVALAQRPPAMKLPQPPAADNSVAQLQQQMQRLERRLAAIETLLQQILDQRQPNPPEDVPLPK